MKYQNYTTIKKYSETIKNVHLSDIQRSLINDVIFDMAKTSNVLNNLISGETNVLLLPLAMLEGESSSLIEGTRTQIEDMVYDIEEMNNIPQWETRNLLNIYTKYTLDNYYKSNTIFSVDRITNIHLELYENNKSSKFQMVHNTTKYIERIKPGTILSDDDGKWNFIGNSNDINKASLVLLKPSLKREYLDDMMKTINKKIIDKSLLIDHIAILHPVFEAIHPFNDGNGRIGRLLLTMLLNKIYNKNEFSIYLSEAFNERKDEYKEKLQNVQLAKDGDNKPWEEWITFFIDCLIKTKETSSERISKIVSLWEKYDSEKVWSTPIRKEIGTIFFKYYKINKKTTIHFLKNKFPNFTVQTIYKDWKVVTEKMGIVQTDGDYFEFTNLYNIIRNK